MRGLIPRRLSANYFFTMDELNEILNDFSLIKVEEDKKKEHYCVLVKKGCRQITH